MANRHLTRVRIPLLAFVLCLHGPLASAVDLSDSGWYAGASLPIMGIDDSDTRAIGTIAGGGAPIDYTATAHTEYGTGFKLSGILGYELDSGVRVEGEVFFAKADVDKLTYTNVAVPMIGYELPHKVRASVRGSVEQFGGLLNVWYDFDTGGVLQPYVGGGIGLFRVDQGKVKYDQNALAQSVSDDLRKLQGQEPVPLPPGYVPVVSSTDTVTAFQIGAGAGYKLSERITIQAGYRLQTTGDLSFDGRNETASAESTTKLRIHLFDIGVRYRF